MHGRWAPLALVFRCARTHSLPPPSPSLSLPPSLPLPPLSRSGAQIAQYYLHTTVPSETTEHRTQFIDRGAADTAGPAPKPLDGLDGHLVMAHGTSAQIVNRRPPADHYLTLHQAFELRLPDEKVLGGRGAKLAGNYARTDLIRQKALLRAAGVDSWDPPSVYKAGVPDHLPMTVTPSATPVLGHSTEGVSASAQFASVQARVLGQSTTLAVTAEGPAKGFARDGSFTKAFKQSLMKA